MCICIHSKKLRKCGIILIFHPNIQCTVYSKSFEVKSFMVVEMNCNFLENICV